MEKQFNCLELFAGCGGLGYGFHKQGFHISVCNELEDKIADTYKENFTDTNVIVGDITEDAIKNSIIENFKSKSCDVIIGGPPCVAYSMSGHRNSRDPRGKLFKDYVEMVKLLKPKVFVMENVKGILTIMHDKPNLTKKEKESADKYYQLEKNKLDILAEKKRLSSKDKDSSLDLLSEIEKNKNDLKKINSDLKEKNILNFRMKVTDIIKETFIDLGYNVEMKLLNSANFGVPQKRERVIFIGLRNDIGKDITYPLETHNKEGNNGKKKWVSVKDAIDDLKEREGDDTNNKDGIQHIYTSHRNDFLDKIKKTKQGTSVNPKYTEAFFRCREDEPSNTVKENHGGVFIHYEKDRVMTPRELARLQSFPDDFIFKGTKSKILVQLGNAVPCGLSNAIAQEIKNILS